MMRCRLLAASTHRTSATAGAFVVRLIVGPASCRSFRAGNPDHASMPLSVASRRRRMAVCELEVVLDVKRKTMIRPLWKLLKSGFPATVVEPDAQAVAEVETVGQVQGPVPNACAGRR